MDDRKPTQSPGEGKGSGVAASVGIGVGIGFLVVLLIVSIFYNLYLRHRLRWPFMKKMQGRQRSNSRGSNTIQTEADASTSQSETNKTNFPVAYTVDNQSIQTTAGNLSTGARSELQSPDRDQTLYHDMGAVQQGQPTDKDPIYENLTQEGSAYVNLPVGYPSSRQTTPQPFEEEPPIYDVVNDFGSTLVSNQ